MKHLKSHPALALMVFLLVASCKRSEQPHHLYSTHAEAIAAGQPQRAWIPVWLPSEASEIHVQGDAGTSRRWLRFRLPAAAAGPLKAQLVNIPSDQSATITFNSPSKSDWWFKERDLKAEFFQERPGTGKPVLFVAFDRASDHVFVWSAGGY